MRTYRLLFINLNRNESKIPCFRVISCRRSAFRKGYPVNTDYLSGFAHRGVLTEINEARARAGLLKDCVTQEDCVGQVGKEGRFASCRRFNPGVMKLPVFVIQKHYARPLHYDFRLEADGVLKSFVVPKGPSLDPHEKRLAIRTPDHPLAYADFEGVIPEGEEGAGVVLIWDRGVYLNLTTADDGKTPVSVAEALRKGHLSVEIKGKKLQGGFAFHVWERRGYPGGS